MKALLVKDIYSIWKQLRLMLVILVIFAVMPDDYMNVLALTIAAMMPYTAAAYDERSRWNLMAAMMPYTPLDLVLSKYVLGWLMIGGAALLSVLMHLVRSLFMDRSWDLTLIAISILAAVMILNIALPLIFRFGVEKGRLVTIFLIALVCGSAGSLSQVETVAIPASGVIILLGTLITVPVTVISIMISGKVYRHSLN